MTRLINTPSSVPVSVVQGTTLLDQFGRYKRKLRLSLTDRCNFRCSYCMPEHPEWLDKRDFMDSNELYSIAALMVNMGIRSIRLTGGEPLLRPDVLDCVQNLNRLKKIGLERLSMTTNAYYLDHYAKDLKKLGLDDINVSLDSIHPNTFKEITGRSLQPVLDGIATAQHAGLEVKLNCVLVKGKNDADILSLTRWAYHQQLPLRFIEYMPLDQPDNWSINKVVMEDYVINTLMPHFSIEQIPRSSNPATLYRLNGQFNLGVISTISKPFCQSCDRLRLTATGDLYTCLFARQGTPLRTLLQQQNNALLAQTISNAVWHKDAGYIEQHAAAERRITMHMLGG